MTKENKEIKMNIQSKCCPGLTYLEMQNMTLVSEVGKIPLAPNDICTVLWHGTAFCQCESEMLFFTCKTISLSLTNNGVFYLPAKLYNVRRPSWPRWDETTQWAEQSCTSIIKPNTSDLECRQQRFKQHTSEEFLSLMKKCFKSILAVELLKYCYYFIKEKWCITWSIS